MAPLHTVLYISLLIASLCYAHPGIGVSKRSHESSNSISRITNAVRQNDGAIAQRGTAGSIPSLLEIYGDVSSKIADIQTKHEELLARNAVLQQRLDESEKRNQKLDALIGKLEGIFGTAGGDDEVPSKDGVRERDHIHQDEDQDDGIEVRIQTLSDYLGNREAELVAYSTDSVITNDNKAIEELRDQLPDGAKKTLHLLEMSLLQLVDRAESMEADINDMKTKIANGRSTFTSDTATNSFNPQLLERHERASSSATDLVNADKVLFAVAATSSQYGLSGIPQTVRFQDAMENNGGDYVASNHTFVCRVPGWYYFSFSLRTIDSKYIGVFLMKNQDLIVAMYTDASDRNTMETQSTILQLEAGDAVWLRLGPSNTYGIYSDSYRYSTFTGFLVYPS